MCVCVSWGGRAGPPSPPLPQNGEAAGVLGVVIAPCACTTAAFGIWPWGCKAVAALISPPPPPQLPAGFGALRLGEGRLGGAGGEERVPERLRVWAQGFCEAQEELNGCPRRAVRAVPALESRKHGVCVWGGAAPGEPAEREQAAPRGANRRGAAHGGAPRCWGWRGAVRMGLYGWVLPFCEVFCLSCFSAGG